MTTKLFVGNLSFTTDSDSLINAFSECGNVQEVKLIKDSMTNKSRGFAFVQMTTTAEAQKAISDLNGAEVEGRTIVVSVAKDREPRSKMVHKNW